LLKPGTLDVTCTIFNWPKELSDWKKLTNSMNFSHVTDEGLKGVKELKNLKAIFKYQYHRCGQGQRSHELDDT
jgi:hypothetical protein